MSWPALNETFLAAAAATFNFRLGLPVPLAITPDGAVLFRRTPARSFASDLYQLDTNTGAITTVVTAAQLLGGTSEQLSDAEKARRERTRTATRGIVSIGVASDGRRLLIPLGERLFILDRDPVAGTTTAPRELQLGGGFPFDPQLSPDGTTVAFVRDGDLWTATASGDNAAPRRLTQHPVDIEYGVADFAAQEELHRTRGYWWSPDSRALVFQRTDARAVDTLYVADARHPAKPPVPFKYPRAGRNNAVVDLAIIAVDASPAVEPTWNTWDTARLPYLATVTWTAGAPLAYTLLDRDQTEISLFTVDAKTGVSTRIQHETDPTWINLSPGTPRWLDDGSGYLWMTEASGHWVLERRNSVGELLAVLTEPSLGLRAVVGVDEKAGVAYVQASADPRQLHVYKISLTGTGPSPAIAISDLDSGGITTAEAKHGVMVLGSALRTGGTRSVAIGRNGLRSELPSVAELPSLQPTTQLSQVQAPATPDAPERSFYTAITRPRDFDASKTYPVLLKVYAGPHAIMVTDSRDAYLMDQWYADAGFIVVRADGRGTPHRGRAWERPILHDLITVPMQDQVAALQALAAAHPEMDMHRVGVFGWSFGGYFSTMAALLHGDIFKAAVAGAPVTDWELYDTAYTERYMKTPAANPDGYRRTSALTHAAKLQRPLLVIHGITDDNVHFAHTLALIEALYVEGKRAEVVTLSATHMVPDPKLNLAREKVQVDFFRQHLAD